VSYVVNILPRAERDLYECHAWIASFSEDAARRWYTAFNESLDRVCRGPLSYALAPEAARLKAPIRVFVFFANSARRYHGLFVVQENEIQVLRVRGPGQPPVQSDEIGIVI
jgi:plasmid stabilization system protein ParE